MRQYRVFHQLWQTSYSGRKMVCWRVMFQRPARWQPEWLCNSPTALQSVRGIQTPLAKCQHKLIALTRACKQAKGATQNSDGIFQVNNTPVLPKSLFKAAAIVTHGPCHVSTGGMSTIIQQHFTTYGLNSYLKNFCKACVVCVKHNPKEIWGQKETLSQKPLTRFKQCTWTSLNSHKVDLISTV